MSWTILYTKQGLKDKKIVMNSELRPNAEKILELLRENPFLTPPPYKKLVGDLRGAYSRRLNVQHRVVYQLYAEEKIVKIISMWSHYE